MTFKERHLLEEDIGRSIINGAKNLYYKAKGEPGWKDFGPEETVKHTGKEWIINPQEFGKEVAGHGNKWAYDAVNKLDTKDPLRGAKIADEVREKAINYLKDDAPKVAKEQEEILSAMMKEPVRYSDRFYDSTLNDRNIATDLAIGKINGIAQHQNRILQSNPDIIHAVNTGKAAMQNIDKLDPLDQMRIHDIGKSPLTLPEDLHNFGFI